MAFRPTPDEERWIAMGSRLKAGAADPWLVERAGGWKTVSTRMRCVLFVLAAVAAGLATAVCDLLHIPAYMWLAALILGAVAEWLVIKRRLYGAGIEEALELAALLLIVFGITESIGYSHDVVIELLMAAALLVAGIRFLNPLFIVLSAVAVSFAIRYGVSQTAGSVFCFAVAILALGFGAQQFRRPAYERMLDFLVVAMPVAGYIWTQSFADTRPQALPLVMLFPYATVALLFGIGRRSHALIAAFMVSVGCLAYELRNLTGLTLEVRLMVWGGVVLAVVAELERYLRTPKHGITSRKAPGEDESSFDLLQIIGAAAVTPAAVHDGDSQFKGGGGRSGGGGASGAY